MYQRLLNAGRQLGSLSLGLLLGGCADAAQNERAGWSASAIVNGYRSEASDDSVVQLTAKPPNSTPAACSGVLIAPNIVLTAVHCVAQYNDGTFSCNADGTIDASNPGDGSLGELAPPAQIVVRSGVFPTATVDAVAVKVFGTGTNQICRNDLALLVLDRDLPLPVAALRLTRGVEIGEAVRVVGYGATESSGSTGRFARDHLRILDRGDDAGGSVTGNAAPRTLVVGEGPCHGDSGGPVFSEQTGAVVGVYSLAVASSCTAISARNVYTRVAPFAALVDAAFEFAGATPIAEASPSENAGDGGAAAAGQNAGGSGSSAAASAGTNSSPAGGSGGARRPGGSGSNQDTSCACRSAAAQSAPEASLLPLFSLFLLLVRRRTAA